MSTKDGVLSARDARFFVKCGLRELAISRPPVTPRPSRESANGAVTGYQPPLGGPAWLASGLARPGSARLGGIQGDVSSCVGPRLRLSAAGLWGPFGRPGVPVGSLCGTLGCLGVSSRLVEKMDVQMCHIHVKYKSKNQF